MIFNIDSDSLQYILEQSFKDGFAFAHTTLGSKYTEEQMNLMAKIRSDSILKIMENMIGTYNSKGKVS